MLSNLEYFLDKNEESNQYLHINISFTNSSNAPSEWLLPNWRPGRYEFQNFAKNVVAFTAYDADQQKVKVKKLQRDTWQVAQSATKIQIIYYAAAKNAGSSFVDESTFYVNFVNCIPYPKNQIETPSKISIGLNDIPNFACSLALKYNKKTNRVNAVASNFYELYDCPFLANKIFTKHSYTVDKTVFTLNIAGKSAIDIQKLLPQFEQFTKLQRQIMGKFPFKKYDFLLWVLPEPYYHGVEHTANTMLVLGPDTADLSDDLLGVSSHELFHAWNICTIRPQELLPYDFQKEKYFDTGYIVEGVTTYLGDLFLLHSGVISAEKYLVELNYNLLSHFKNGENNHQSLADSSIDLWIDGYGEGAPFKKVSIYSKGMLVALMLDLKIRLKTQHTKSLYDVMAKMNQIFGGLQKGYQSADFEQIAREIYRSSLDHFFEEYVFGTRAVLPYLKTLLLEFGIEIIQTDTLSLQKTTDLSLSRQTNYAHFFGKILK